MPTANCITSLKKHVLTGHFIKKVEAELIESTGKNENFTVFLSVCNKKERARVFHGSGNTLNIAWINAEKSHIGTKKTGY